ncbi:MAG: response regulator, partial [Anaerolineae bacterium]
MNNNAIHVLSIEDNPADAFLIQEKLAEAQHIGWNLPSFEIEHVSRLQTALARLSEAEYDVVLTDLDLPDSRAEETVATLREHIPHMPLVVLTGREDEMLARKSVRAGVQDYLYKNEATGSLLARTLMYALERHQIHAELEQRVIERTAELQQSNQDLRQANRALAAEIAERKRVEEALQQSEQRFRTIVDVLPQFVAYTDKDLT